MKFTYSGVFLGSVMLATGFVACSGGGETTTTTTTGSDATTSGSSSSSTSGGTGGAGGSGGAATSSAAGTGGGAATSSSASSTSSTGTGMAVLGYCTKPCGTVADCCPVGGMNCPSNMYPNNYTCDKSACKSPECATTADCAALDPAQGCLVLSGFNTCVNTCVTDGECKAPATCSGADDNGKKYCLAPSGGGCTDDASCSGFGKCVNKVCVCEKASDCTKAGFTACAL